MKPNNRILVVADGESVCTALTLLLEAVGYSVSCARNDEDALDQLRRGEPPLVVLFDLNMAGTTKWLFRKALQQLPSLASIPVLVFSSEALSAASTGFTDLLAAIRLLTF